MSVNKYIGIILSAGNGKRLGNKYKNISKVLIPIYKKNTPLDYNIKILENFGVQKKFINTHKHHKKINQHIIKNYKTDNDIELINENKLLGTAQSVFNISKLLKNYDKIVVLYGDNISKINLKKTIKNYKIIKSDFCMVSNRIKDSGSSGVIKFNKKNKLISFEEKNDNYKNKPNWVNSGIYIISKRIVKLIGKKKDFGHDFIPYLVKKNISIEIFKTRSKILTIDSPDLLKKTKKKIYF